MTTLYNVPRKTWIKTDLGENILFFDHIDGIYSFCKDEEGNVVHLSAFTEVEIMETEPNVPIDKP